MWKIIMVEDEQPILDLHKLLLEKEGLFQVIATFTSPLEAITQILSIKGEYDALILDIEMPKMNGLELAAILVEEGIDVPIIFSTAYAKYAVDAFRVQALDYVLKPMTPGIVLQVNERLTKYYGRQTQRNTTKLEVSLKGEVGTRIHDKAIKWRTKVTEELFYYLLVHEGIVVSKYRILDDIWPNIDEKKALANLYNTIYRLRQLFIELGLPIQIERVNEGYELKTNDAIVITSTLESDAFLLESKGYLWAYHLN
ncbi:response regulator receiver protein [Lysinibacillus sp. YS11]|uniref:response regulator n=1 Tax=Lysinibacillus TaxID=400634 RepID=UPI000CA39933|nr:MULTISPECIES: response regulator [Lysinibacillus]AUS88133.1 response regulator receiver protein [Lysinibacillus sp. YS11]MDP1394520.1 response regulator [Lysinibacillus capsici]MDP1414811.1 response regulator [Lysinibacillus capsici]MDP1430704.1 response regulator [Lysinibacillus capsici]MEC1304370.1 response regulator [Lysinibacillus capsici]